MTELAENRRTRVPGATAEASGPLRSAGALCIGFLGADWWGSDARAMAAGLRRQGHLVLERHYEDYLPTKWRHPLLKVVRRLMRSVMARDYNRSVEELLSVSALDFLLVFKGMLLAPESLAAFKRKGIPCYCFYPDVSFHDHGANIPACLPLYDCVFTTKHFHLEDPVLRGMSPNWVHARHGFDPEVHRPLDPDARPVASYAADVSFVGNWSPKKEAILTGLRSRLPEIDLKIWGPGWQSVGDEVRRCWQGRGAYGDELAAIYSQSKINLGLLSEGGTGVSSGDAMTARTWQIPGAGGFLLHEDTPEVRDAFVAGREIALFDSEEALVQAVREFLGDEVRRRAVAAAGHERATSEPYTYDQAVDLILDHHQRHRSR